MQFTLRDGQCVSVLVGGAKLDHSRDQRVAFALNITELKRTQSEREALIVQLQAALSKVKLLSGLVPICANCKKIRDNKGTWNYLETYIQKHSEAEFTHSICPECIEKLYPELGKPPAHPLDTNLKDV
jgi:hypothetical protein